MAGDDFPASQAKPNSVAAKLIPGGVQGRAMKQEPASISWWHFTKSSVCRRDPAYFKRDEKLSPRHSWRLKARWLAFQERRVKPRWHRSIWVREFCQPKCPEQFQIRGGEAARRCSVPLSSRRVLPPRLLHFSRNWSDAELRPGPVDWMYAASVFFIFFLRVNPAVYVCFLS